MKKEDKVNLVLAGAGVLVALYAFMPKGGQEPGSSGGLGAGLGGLSSFPGGGGGGADTPTVNIDFPAIPSIPIPGENPFPFPGPAPEPFPVPDQTKKEQAMGIDASGLPPWEVEGMGSLLKDPSNPNVTGLDIKNLPYILKASDSKKEQAKKDNPLNSFVANIISRLPGIKSEYVTRPAGNKSSSGRSGEITRYPVTLPTKKESITGGSSGGGIFYIPSTKPWQASIPVNKTTGKIGAPGMSHAAW